MKKRTLSTAWSRTISTGVFAAALFAVVLLTLVMPTQAKAVKETCDVHEWGEWQVWQQPTCTADGEEYRKCNNCVRNESRAIPAKGHTWGNWWTVQQPTCTEAGMEVRSCQNCDTNEDRAIPATGHSWGTPRIELEPTCTSAGKGRHSCAKCRTRGELFEIPALGHDWVTVENTPGTCIRPARTVKQCSRCGEQDITEGAYGTHVWGEWETMDATCTENGMKVRTCTLCPTGIEHKTIFAYGHKMVPDETVKGTCVTEGYVSVKCTRCGHTEKESLGYGGHVWGAWETIEATCTHNGEKVRYCTKCAKGVDRKVLPALGHDMVPGETVLANCVEWGYTTTVCTRCGYVEYEERPNDGYGTHFWGDWTDDPENLIKFRICKRCGARAEAPINASLQLKAERLTPIQLRQDAAASGERTYAVDFDVTFTNTGDLPLFGCLAELIFASDGIALGEAVSVETYTVLEKGESISATITFTIAPDLFETKIAPNIGQDGVFTDIIFLAEALTVDTWKTVSDSMQLACPVVYSGGDHHVGSTRILSPDLKLTMWTEIGDRPVQYGEWVNYYYRVENTGDEAIHLTEHLMSGYVNGSYGHSSNARFHGETLQPGETSQEYYVSFRPNILTIGENDQGEKGMKLSFFIRGYKSMMDETLLESNECSFWNPLEGEATPMLSVEFITATVEDDTVLSWWMLTNPGNLSIRLKAQEVLDLTGNPAEYDSTYLEGDMRDGWIGPDVYQLFCLEFPITAEDTAAGHCFRSVQYTGHLGDGALVIETDDYTRDDRYDQNMVIASNIAVMDVPQGAQGSERPVLLLMTTADPMNGDGVTIGQHINRKHLIFNISDAPIRLEGLYALQTGSPIAHFIDEQLRPECSTWVPTGADVTDAWITRSASGEMGVEQGYYVVGYTADGQKVVSNTSFTWHPLAEDAASAEAFVGTLFAGKTYTAGGVSMDAAQMGKAYTIILNTDGTVTYTMAGVEIPGFTWKMTDDRIEVAAYGNVVMTLTTQADGTMLLDYNGAFTLLMEPQQ